MLGLTTLSFLGEDGTVYTTDLDSNTGFARQGVGSFSISGNGMVIRFYYGHRKLSRQLKFHRL